MKILLVSPVPPPAGGIASWTKMYLDSEFAKANEIHLVNTAVQGKRIQDLTRRNLFSEVHRTYCILNDLKAKLNNNDIDIIHLNSPCSKTGLIRDYICFKIANRFNIKKVIHFRCDVTFMINNRISLWFFKKICCMSDKVLVLNTVSKNFIYRETGVEAKIIPNFISEDMINTKKRKVINGEVKKVLYAGHITNSKGCGIILDVAAESSQYEFIMIGYVSKEMRSRLIPSNVKLIGERPHEIVLKMMMESDIFLFPSYSEGFPNVISEAMGIGMPIIASDVGAIPDMLEGLGGILIPAGDKKACINALTEIQSASNRKRFSEWNQKKVENYYLKDKVLANLESIYKNMM